MNIKLFQTAATRLLKVITISLASAVILSGCFSSNEESSAPKTIRLDYAYYSPTSLALKEYGWLEEALATEGIQVEWYLSHGSNKALEFLNSNSVDFGSTAGAAALISKSNGSPIKNVYIYSQPEWTALVSAADSGINEIADLRGKKVAATLGTDPYIFLLRALSRVGIQPNEVDIVNLQHGDGATALTTGAVQAWAGLDPHMARLELESGAQLFFRDVNLNTYGFLNVREQFAERYPEYVKVVIEAYEKARAWTLENPDKAAEILARDAQISLDVAKIQITRNTFTHAIPSEVQFEAIIEAGKILQDAAVINAKADLNQLAESLIDPTYAEQVVKF